jgi:hypothetical protein
MTEPRGRPITVVTGPLRSGTSCVTGLLESCGFDLGRALPVLRNPTEHNPRGHFELGLLFTINARLCLEVPGGDHNIFQVPERAAMDALAARRHRYFRVFIDSFDGELCKDPLLCLTWPYWELHWPELAQAVFCLRHPLSVAQSMKRRYRIDIARGLALWQIYATRFFDAATRSRIYVLDFDTFCRSPVETFTPLLHWLGRPLARDALRSRIDEFFGSEFVHHGPEACEDHGSTQLPDEVRRLYIRLRSEARR